MSRPASPVAIARLCAVLLLVVAAPTVGDIGSCGAPRDELDPVAFFKQKASLDCARCSACDLHTQACARACAAEQAPTTFPAGCYPLSHDGEVCLRALSAAACAQYRGFVADQGATIPTECNFCPAEAR